MHKTIFIMRCEKYFFIFFVNFFLNDFMLWIDLNEYRTTPWLTLQEVSQLQERSTSALNMCAAPAELIEF